MAKLKDYAKLIRSKNAGAFELTLDVMFDDEKVYQHVASSGVMTRGKMADFFNVPEDQVKLFYYDPANAIKVTIPRAVPAGDPADTDLFGGQQFGPLVDLDVPEF